MLLGDQGTSRSLLEAGCALAQNWITAAGINQQALLNLLLGLTGKAKFVELFRKSGHRSAALGLQGELFLTPADSCGPVERPNISMPYFFHSDTSLWKLEIQHSVAPLTPSPKCFLYPHLPHELSGVPQVGRREAGFLGAVAAQGPERYLANSPNPCISEIAGGGDHRVASLDSAEQQSFNGASFQIKLRLFVTL